MSEHSLFESPEPNPVTLSPCVRNCCLDENDVCCGCKRTISEIVNWNQFTRQEKLAKLEELKTRV